MTDKRTEAIKWQEQAAKEERKISQQINLDVALIEISSRTGERFLDTGTPKKHCFPGASSTPSEEPFVFAYWIYSGKKMHWFTEFLHDRKIPHFVNFDLFFFAQMTNEHDLGSMEAGFHHYILREFQKWVNDNKPRTIYDTEVKTGGNEAVTGSARKRRRLAVADRRPTPDPDPDMPYYEKEAIKHYDGTS